MHLVYAAKLHLQTKKGGGGLNPPILTPIKHTRITTLATYFRRHMYAHGFSIYEFILPTFAKIWAYDNFLLYAIFEQQASLSMQVVASNMCCSHVFKVPYLCNNGYLQFVYA